MRRFAIATLSFAVFAIVVYAVLEWLVPALASTTKPSASGFNYGASFTVPFSRALAPWLAIVIAALGPLVWVRGAIDRRGRRR